MEGGDGQPKSWGCHIRCRAKCSNRSLVVFPSSGWTGTRCASEYKGPEAYPPNNTTMSIERL